MWKYKRDAKLVTYTVADFVLTMHKNNCFFKVIFFMF